jgi:hypothetical protein
MKKLPLPSEITTFFPDHEEHDVRNLFITVQGIHAARTTNLNKVKDKLSLIIGNGCKTKPESNYKRLTRFFQLPDKEKAGLIKALLCLCMYTLRQKGGKPKYLVLDGTSWELGTKKIHLLTLGVLVNGVCIPICWEDLDKKGTSCLAERKALLDRACQWYRLRGMILLADREYIGEEWFNYLSSKGIEFIIRLRAGIYKEHVDSQTKEVDKYFKHQRWRYSAMEREARKVSNHGSGVSKQVEILGGKYTFVIFKNPKDGATEELFYYISTLRKRQNIVRLYPARWKIECCFKHLKSNGFNLEALNVRDCQKVKLMMAMVTFMYVLCANEGLLAYKDYKKSDYKTYSDGSVTLAVSIFRKGLSLIEGKFHEIQSFAKYLHKILGARRRLSWAHVQ